MGMRMRMLKLGAAMVLFVVTIFSNGRGVRCQYESRRMTLVNKCKQTVWPGIQPGAGHVVLERGGACLAPETAKSFDAPLGWSGRIWARHNCSFDDSGNNGRCTTGDCGGAFFCNGLGGAPPATLVEITLATSPCNDSSSSACNDFYDVSLVDGYNLPVTICPAEGGSGQCGLAGCSKDLNEVCPRGLAVVEEGQVVACNSACSAFDSPEYCCTGRYGDPHTCAPNVYSTLFKSNCPSAYSYAYDDATSLLTCSGSPHYVITFCPA
ncbi:hypothetical protein KI387_005805 [Taxus chinensis]|uniref:Thaumatin-like protein n=1 Tax=Taxus chinensis TaxID=29808 RepID=A0AA38LLH0_TAXCH|nr:hypothetical protein KI387_005805 [Taxus chinensis]